MKHIVAFIVTLGGLMSTGLEGQIGETREWTSSDGRTITAELVTVTESDIVVRREGRSVTIKMEQLSESDQAFARSLLEGNEEEERRALGFKDGKYADAVKGKWIKFPATDESLLFQLYIGREATRKSAGSQVPLFIHLHGASSRGLDVQVGKVEFAPQTVVNEDFYDDHPCVVCVPTCPPEPQSWQKQTAKLEALVDDLTANLPIDRNRIYLSGYSMGGQGIGKMLLSRPDFYAGAIFADGGPSEDWAGKVKTPMWSYYSPERDSKKAEEIEESFKADGVEFRFTRLPDSIHNNIHAKMARSPDVFAWLYEQQR